MIVLIPAYEPDAQLLLVVRSIQAADPTLTVVVVDDGSGPSYASIFAALHCVVLGYPTNRGKGNALKTGLRYIANRFPGQDVVCADSDGQHSVVDILRVARRVAVAPGAIVLGERRFSGTVPLRSRIGNTATRWLFGLATGRRIHDTQTGLRGYPAAMVPWLISVRGDRYEYELNILLDAGDAGFVLDSVEIATIYLDANQSSHFRPIADSMRIYAPLLAFIASSLLAFTVDTVALLLLNATIGSLLVAVAGARLLSSGVNFLVNRRLVFEHGRDKPRGAAAAQYFALVAGLLALNYGLLVAFTGLGVPLLLGKIGTEMVLFLVSFAVQRRFIFARNRRGIGVPDARSRGELMSHR